MGFKGDKGQWYIYGDGKWKLSIDSRINDGRSICGPTTLATINTNSPQEEVLANALLMSKSKEMLELLNDLHRHLCYPYMSGEQVGVYRDKVKELIKSATTI